MVITAEWNNTLPYSYQDFLGKFSIKLFTCETTEKTQKTFVYFYDEFYYQSVSYWENAPIITIQQVTTNLLVWTRAIM